MDLKTILSLPDQYSLDDLRYHTLIDGEVVSLTMTEFFGRVKTGKDKVKARKVGLAVVKFGEKRSIDVSTVLLGFGVFKDDVPEFETMTFWSGDGDGDGDLDEQVKLAWRYPTLRDAKIGHADAVMLVEEWAIAKYGAENVSIMHH